MGTKKQKLCIQKRRSRHHELSLVLPNVAVGVVQVQTSTAAVDIMVQATCAADLHVMHPSLLYARG